MSELGCPGDWDESCAATDMTPVAGTSLWEYTATVPAGSYEFKVRLNGSWDENYGDSSGTYDKGGNIPLPLEAAAKLRFVYDHASTLCRSCRPNRSRRLGAADQRAGRDQPAQGPHQGALLLRHGRPLRERDDRPTTRAA